MNADLRADQRGVFYRNVGWMPQADPDSRSQQAKFPLGRDRDAAVARLAVVRAIWDRVVEESPPGDAAWDDRSLAVARAVGRGDRRVVIGRPATGYSDLMHFHRVGEWASRLPGVEVLPGDPGGYERGKM